jgi:hypothetical protein
MSSFPQIARKVATDLELALGSAHLRPPWAHEHRTGGGRLAETRFTAENDKRSWKVAAM